MSNTTLKNPFKVVVLLLTGGLVMTGLNVAETRAEERYGLFSAVLKEHVKGGLVNYKGLKEDGRFTQFIKELAATNPEKFVSKQDQLAFWINVYNAYTLKIICDNYPVKSISELHTGGLVLGAVLKKTVWHKDLVTVNNQVTSLDFIEHKILRPVFEEPRIHFAIVCAARGCPPLRDEAYETEKLNYQLNDQAQKFLAAKDRNSFDVKNKVAVLSPIFQWFKKDFASDNAGLLVYLSLFLPEDTAAAIKSGPKSWKIKYSKYDWSLNEQ